MLHIAIPLQSPLRAAAPAPPRSPAPRPHSHLPSGSAGRDEKEGGGRGFIFTRGRDGTGGSPHREGLPSPPPPLFSCRRGRRCRADGCGGRAAGSASASRCWALGAAASRAGPPPAAARLPLRRAAEPAAAPGPAAPRVPSRTPPRRCGRRRAKRRPPGRTPPPGGAPPSPAPPGAAPPTAPAATATAWSAACRPACGPGPAAPAAPPPPRAAPSPPCSAPPTEPLSSQETTSPTPGPSWAAAPWGCSSPATWSQVRGGGGPGREGGAGAAPFPSLRAVTRSAVWRQSRGAGCGALPRRITSAHLCGYPPSSSLQQVKYGKLGTFTVLF